MQQSETRPTLDVDQEYRSIEAALVESGRGRWFLAEHARRSRRMESVALEEALGRLKSSLRDPPALVGRLKGEIEALSQMIAVTREELIARAPAPKDGTVEHPSSGAQGILHAAEELHELAWSLQGQDLAPEVCEKLARQTARIFALSAQQAQESRRALTYIATLDTMTNRLATILETIALESDIAGDEPRPLTSETLALTAP